MLKKTLITLCIAAGLTVLLHSCDKVEAPYVIKNADTTYCEPVDFPPLTSSYKRVMVEDYTGHKCPNCALGGKAMHDLIEKYGDSVIAMAVHTGDFASVNPNDPVFNYDFRTATGDVWRTDFEVELFPIGIVNRKKIIDNKLLIPTTSWDNAVKQELTLDPVADVQIINEFDEAKGKLCIHTKTTFLAGSENKNLNLLVLITESGIIAPQKNIVASLGPTPTILDYEHNHVLRGVVNGNWGVSVRSGTATDPVAKSYGVYFNGFNINQMLPENCSVVAILFDTDTKEVLQVSEKSVIE